MKIINNVLTAFGIAAMVTVFAIGCTTVATITTQPNGTTVTNTAKVFDLQTATNSINAVVPAAVKVLVAKEPASKPYLQDAAFAVEIFVNGSDLSPAALKAVLASTGINELKTDEATAITETVLALYQTYFGQVVQDKIAVNPNVVPLLHALSDSIMQGLQP